VRRTRERIVRAEPSEPRDLTSVTYTHSDVMVTWRPVSDPRGDVVDIVYVVDFRSADDDVTSCAHQWSVNGSVKVTNQLSSNDEMSTLVTDLCPSTEFTFTVSRQLDLRRNSNGNRCSKSVTPLRRTLASSPP